MTIVTTILFDLALVALGAACVVSTLAMLGALLASARDD